MAFFLKNTSNHNSEIFDYIRELHLFLHELCDTVQSHEGSDLGERAEATLRKLQRRQIFADELRLRLLKLEDKRRKQ